MSIAGQWHEWTVDPPVVAERPAVAAALAARHPDRSAPDLAAAVNQAAQVVAALFGGAARDEKYLMLVAQDRLEAAQLREARVLRAGRENRRPAAE